MLDFQFWQPKTFLFIKSKILNIIDWKFFMNTAGTELPLVRLDEMSLSLTGNVVECGLLLPTFKSRLTDVHALYRYFIDMGIR